MTALARAPRLPDFSGLSTYEALKALANRRSKRRHDRSPKGARGWHRVWASAWGMARQLAGAGRRLTLRRPTRKPEA